MLQSPEAFRTTTLGGAVGAALGVMIVLALVVFNIGFARDLDSDLLPWLGVLAAVIVSQFALAGGLCAFAFDQPERAR